MALVTKNFGWSDAMIVLTYDDATLKLNSVSCANNSSNSIRIEVSGNLVWSRTLDPGDSVSFDIPPGQRPRYTVETTEKYPFTVRGIGYTLTAN